MIRLSVNVNKVATLRNSRGGDTPSVERAVEVIVDAGARGITVHPRADARHIRFSDVENLAKMLDRDRVELNIEGDPRPDLVELVLRIRPHQFTIVPVRPGELTSEAGWPADTPVQVLSGLIGRLREAGIRSSVFVEANAEAVAWAAALGADRVELYTEPYARAYERGLEQATTSFAAYRAVAERAHALGLGINAGHDLDLENLRLFRALPHLAEVSIGHALLARALFVGLGTVISEYLEILRDPVSA